MTHTHKSYTHTHINIHIHTIEAANEIYWIEQQPPVASRGFENKSNLHIYFRDPRNS